MRRAQLLPSCVVVAAVQGPSEDLGSFQAPGEGHTIAALMLEEGNPKHSPPPSPTWQGHWGCFQTLAKNPGKLLMC